MCMCWYTVGWTSAIGWASAIGWTSAIRWMSAVGWMSVVEWASAVGWTLWMCLCFHLFLGQRSLHGNLYLGKKDTGSVLQESEFQVTEESKVRLAHCFKPHPTTPHHCTSLHAPSTPPLHTPLYTPSTPVPSIPYTLP